VARRAIMANTKVHNHRRCIDMIPRFDRRINLPEWTYHPNRDHERGDCTQDDSCFSVSSFLSSRDLFLRYTANRIET